VGGWAGNRILFILSIGLDKKGTESVAFADTRGASGKLTCLNHAISEMRGLCAEEVRKSKSCSAATEGAAVKGRASPHQSTFTLLKRPRISRDGLVGSRQPSQKSVKRKRGCHMGGGTETGPKDTRIDRPKRKM